MYPRGLCLVATGAVMCAVAAFGFASQSPRDRSSGVDTEEFSLKATGAPKLGRAVDEDRPLKTAGTLRAPSRAADEDRPLKAAGASKPGRNANEDQPLKSSASGNRPGGRVEEITPLRSARGVTRPARIEDDGNRM